MISRNESCPCGSGTKYKRCCLPRLDAVARELRERDVVLDELIDWAREHHAGTLEQASRETTLIGLLGGRAARNASVIWAVDDFSPADGGLPVMARFAERADLDPGARAIAVGLADARLDVYRVSGTISGAWLEIEPLIGGSRVRLPCRYGYEALRGGDIVVGRVVSTTAIPTMWGAAKSFPPDTERRWLARLADLPTDRAAAGLVLLGFHPDDAAEPLPEGLDVVSRSWPIVDAEELIDAVEEDDIFECIGQEMSGRWAFAWLDEADCGAVNLGGSREEDGEIEVARLVVGEAEVTLISGDAETLATVAAYVTSEFGDVLGPPGEALAA
jgi:SEC-C motif